MDSAAELQPEFDPRSSTLAFFGAELRLRRQAAHMSQAELAEAVHCERSMISKIESATRVPQRDLAERFDAALGTDGLFARLWPVAMRNAYQPWFRPFVQLEQQAAEIRSYETQLVPGLLQTEGYARAVLAGRRPDRPRLEKALASRMHRQHILDRDEPPRLWVILEEAAVRRRIGGPVIMHGQLERLLAAVQLPHIVVQVVPSDVTAHPALSGSFWHFIFSEGPEVAYLESFLEGQLRAETEVLEAVDRAYDLLRAHALSPEASADLIAAVMKDLIP